MERSYIEAPDEGAKHCKDDNKKEYAQDDVMSHSLRPEIGLTRIKGRR
jgi:hypothetical protein